MNQNLFARRCIAIWLLGTWSMCCSTVTLAQTQIDALPAVSIKDSVFEKVLMEYTQLAGANESVIAVFLERYDNDYTYTLYDFALYDQFKDNPTAAFGRWRTHTLLFYTGLEELATPLDTAKVNQVNRYLRERLPDAEVSEPDPSDPNIIKMTFTTHHPKVWRFKIRAGKLLWIRRGSSYPSEKIPYMKYMK